MCTPHFEIQNGVLTKCRMSGEENVTVTIPDGLTGIAYLQRLHARVARRHLRLSDYHGCT